MRSASKPRSFAAVTAPERNPNSWVANQPSVIVQSGNLTARSRRVWRSVPAAIAVIRSRPDTPPQLLGDSERDRHGGDADMAAGADIVVIEHVAEAAIDEGGPRRRRL